MHRTICFVLLFGLLILPVLASAQDKKPVSPKEKNSYSIGLNLGTNLKQEPIDLDLEMLIQGIRDAVAGKPSLTNQEVAQTLDALQKDITAKKQVVRKQQGEKNIQEGEAFLAANQKKEGVVTLPSGLQYKIMKTGTGPKPKATDKVTTHYRGTFIDGTVFDSSYDRGEPASFQVDGVIAGWTEALQLMPVGSKWQLFIPAKLAYGERGGGDLIGPNATLIFEVELVSIP